MVLLYANVKETEQTEHRSWLLCASQNNDSLEKQELQPQCKSRNFFLVAIGREMQAKSCTRASELRDETYCDDIVPLGKLESVNAEGRDVKKIPAKAQSICPTNAPLTSRRGGCVSFAFCY